MHIRYENVSVIKAGYREVYRLIEGRGNALEVLWELLGYVVMTQSCCVFLEQMHPDVHAVDLVPLHIGWQSSSVSSINGSASKGAQRLHLTPMIE